MAESRVTVVVDAFVGGDELHGSTLSEEGEAEPFLGWLGLITALDRLLGRSGPSSHGSGLAPSGTAVAPATATEKEEKSATFSGEGDGR